MQEPVMYFIGSQEATYYGVTPKVSLEYDKANDLIWICQTFQNATGKVRIAAVKPDNIVLFLEQVKASKEE